MNADCVVKVLLGDSLEDGHCEALSDFSCMRPKEVDAHDSVLVCLVDHHLGVAVLGAVVVEVPLEWPVNAAVCQDVGGSKLLFRVLLAVADTAVLDGREDSGGDVAVAHETSTLIEESSSQQSSCHDGGGSEL